MDPGGAEHLTISRETGIGISKGPDGIALNPKIKQAVAALAEDGRTERIIEGEG